MKPERIARLATSTDSYVKEVYELINNAGNVRTIAGDSMPVVQLSSRHVDELAQIGFEHVKANYLEHGMSFKTPGEVRDEM